MKPTIHFALFIFFICCVSVTLNSQCNSTSPWQGNYGIWSGPGTGGGTLTPSSFLSNGIIKVPANLLVINNPNLALYATSFYFRDTVCITNNFTFETRIRNPNANGGVSANDTRIEILGSGLNAGASLIEIAEASWAQPYTSAWVGGTSITNQPGLMVDLQNWSIIKMEFNNGTLFYYRDNVLFFQLPYTGNICNIHGFNYTFKGSGEIDWIRLTDAYNNVVYFEDFNDCNNFAQFPNCTTPTLTTTYTPPSCSNPNLILNTTPNTNQPLQYSWTGPAGFSSSIQNPSINNATTTNEGTYIVTATSNYCNPPVRDTIQVTIPVSYQTSSQAVNLCSGGSVQLPGGNIVNTTGTYIDTIINNAARKCYDIITTNVTVNNPQINAGPDQLICYGSTAQLNATGTNVLDYSWDPHPTLSATNISNPVASPTTTTSYVVTSKIRMGTNLVTNGDFSQGNSGFSSGYTPITTALSQGQYVVTTSPNVHNSGFTNCGDHTTGNSNMLLLDGACGTNGVPPNTVFWCQTIPVTPNTDYAFSAWLTNVLNSGVSSTLQFTINGVVIGTPPSTTTTACQWSEFYVIWNSGSATSANICIAEGTGVCSGNDFAVDDISFYQICEAKDTVTVRVDRVLASFTDSTQVSCFGLNDGEVTFTPSSGIAPFSYTWSNGQTSSTATNLTAGTYTVTVTDSAGCTANGSITITEPAALSLAFNPATTNLTCFGDLTQITTTVTGGTTPYTYSWNTGASTPDLNNIPIGFYRLEVRDSNNCFIADSTTITQPNLITSSFNTIQCNAPSYTLPSGRIITVSGVYIDTIPNFNGCDSIITLDVKLSNIQATVTPISVTCFGLSDGSASVNAAGGIAPYAYQWSDNQTTPTAYNLIAGNYAVIIRDSVDCRDTLTVQITEPSELIVSTPPPVAFCNGLTTTIEAFANGGIAPYAISWDNGHNNWSQHVQPTSTTTYTATVTDNNGCVKNNSVTITVHPNPVADFSIEPSENIILGTPITITDNSTLADDRDWSMDDGNNYQNDVKFTHLYENEGEYCIELVVTTVNNCTDNHRACITIVPDFSVYIPNTFTPNDDKLNQRFRVVARSFSTMSMSIFNRWGQELIRLEGDQPVMIGWDGTYNGSPAPEGTYAYKLEVFDLKNKKHVYFGQINLIR